MHFTLRRIFDQELLESFLVQAATAYFKHSHSRRYRNAAHCSRQTLRGKVPTRDFLSVRWEGKLNFREQLLHCGKSVYKSARPPLCGRVLSVLCCGRAEGVWPARNFSQASVQVSPYCLSVSLSWLYSLLFLTDLLHSSVIFFNTPTVCVGFDFLSVSFNLLWLYLSSSFCFRPHCSSSAFVSQS